MSTHDFVNRMKEYMDKGVEMSKDALKKTGEIVSDFGDKSVTRISITQLESKAQKNLLELGIAVYEQLASDENAVVSRDNSAVAKLFAEIESTKKQIEEKRSTL